jgi:DNA topoisomerase-2
LENLIRSNLFVYVNMLCPDPRFASQSKLDLTTPRTQFKVKVKDPAKVRLLEEKRLPAKEDIYVHNPDGTVKTAGAMCQLDDAFLNSVISRLHITEDVEQIRAVLEHKQLIAVNKSGKSCLVNGDDYEKAGFAGTKRGHEATLCITEGKSAAAMIAQGFSVVGRERWGLYPLRGKGMNVRGVKLAKMLKNIEFNDLRIILGLEFGRKYTEDKELIARDKALPEDEREGWTHVNTLNYGHVMICADQDHDGSHM